MRMGVARALLGAAAGLWLAACSSTGQLKNPFASDPPAPEAAAPTDALAMATSDFSEKAERDRLLGSDPNDDVALGKKQFRAANFGLAEKHFRHAVELHPRDAEAWLGLAASYDRLRRFDLADRAYAQATAIVGPTVEILNNRGFSYMLRGDYTRARVVLAEAQRRAPGNKYVANNLRLLNESLRQGKQVE